MRIKLGVISSSSRPTSPPSCNNANHTTSPALSATSPVSAGLGSPGDLNAILMAFEIRLQKSESIAAEQLKASQARIEHLEITTLRAVTTANERIKAAERRMTHALEAAKLADEERIKVIEERDEIEERLRKMEEFCQEVVEERDRERTMNEETRREVAGKDKVIVELERTVRDMERRVEMRQDEVRLRRAESLEWWVGLGAGCLMTIGGVGCIFTFGISAMTASVASAGLTGCMTVGGVVCVMDKVLSPSTKEFLRRFLMGLLDEFALAWFVRYWLSSQAIEPPPPYLLDE
ncbi:hypothetical protein AX16_009171 [Volvariella volvacea WC 439]|nr:hypothetical protein AX16_009171 [Volvariella volvacea WC 439]